MKKIINTDNAPAAVGPYSQGIETNDLVFTSGQLPMIPGTTKFVEGGIKEQTRKSLENVEAVFNEAGLDLSDALKATVFLDNMDNFADFNEVYKEFFPNNPPARSCVEVSKLPLGAKVEIEMIGKKK
ncbi:MAG: RidA family protein [Candidatus Mcinerneyibacterium aminivorans]|jgi:2-iminobutanoate/2-iminopropanoate deaminase|uniref:RidA family protein n=1 Tax=Candidatus Mcinerneyibacterium aminivorans TaxID=2703815 RepID=A0A5D0MHL8_9BACT|nr:MAG: RidA family protein [Candidatus Mcinerneyibacterium aminivorans]